MERARRTRPQEKRRSIVVETKRRRGRKIEIVGEVRRTDERKRKNAVGRKKLAGLMHCGFGN